MTEPRFTPPPPRRSLTNPDLWRPSSHGETARPLDMLWLDRGECIDPELTGLAAGLLSEIPPETVFGYPIPGPLYRKLAKHLGLEPENLLLTRGSDGAIKTVFEAYIEPGDTIVISKPSYQMYGVYAQIFDARIHPVPYSPVDGRPVITAARMVEAIGEAKPKMVGLPNPDNPTGFAFDDGEMRAIIEAAGKVGALMLVDEAYYPFLEQTCINWIGEYGHLVVARTFSKAWGMAGIRLGYTAASPEITTMLNKVRTMIEADGPAMALAEKMLDHQDAVDASLARLREGRALFASEMNALGYHAIETPCNFIHVDFGADRQKVEQALAGVATYRVFPMPPLENFIRFTTTTSDLFRPVIEAIRNASV